MFPLHPITPHYIPLHPIIYPIGSMYAIYGNIYHQYTPFMLAYIPYMDPMGYIYIYIYPIISARDSHCRGYFQQLPSELLEVHLNVCHGLLRSTALRCGDARAGCIHWWFFQLNPWDSHGFNGEFT